MRKTSNNTIIRNFKKCNFTSPLKVLVVFAHPDDSESYNAALLEAVLSALSRCGHVVRIARVAGATFNPVLSKHELQKMYSHPGSSPDLSDFIADLKWATAIVYIYPTWWSSVPATLKGWIDRVFVPGVAYDPPSTGEDLIKPVLQIRKTAVITTTGGPSSPETDLGVTLLTETIPTACYVENVDEFLVYKIHSVISGARHLREELEGVYGEIVEYFSSNSTASHS